MSELDIFSAALELADLPIRDRFLDEACRDRPLLRSRIDALLRNARDASQYLESSPQAILATLDQPAVEPVGAQIGPYKLLEQIGEGGMGLVYMAEQQQPLRRLVALKLVKPGMDSKQVIARFEAERQALAMMDHPNIAKIFDAGTTEGIGSRELGVGPKTPLKSPVPDSLFPTPSAGRPYFVMELVRGVPINEFCDQQKLTVRQRLELFIQVCQAVQHAHQKGIIHRDLKPTNVLVTKADTIPLPKVIDFGIAKALFPLPLPLGAGYPQQSCASRGEGLALNPEPRTLNPPYTGFAQLVGTPMYMSPEQAEMNHFGVDTRSDVYSLGVLLYELLTGTTPFDKETLSKAGLDEMRRIIREVEPETVSARIAKTRRVGQGCDSSRRPTEAADVRPSSLVLRPYAELDWIAMKALEKDRSRRYESASALAADIQRYLSDEPVLACPPTTMYRFQKFARKHKPALATATAISLCLILGTSVSAWQAVRATTAEAQANANEQKAAANEQKAVANATAAQEKEQEATKQRDEVKAVNDELRRTVYASNMNLAKSAWDQHAVSRVVNLLDQHRPKPGEFDLRGFEWHFLNRLCNEEARLTLNVNSWIVSSITYSPDGKRLWSAKSWSSSMGVPDEAELKCWDTESGRELFAHKAGGGFERVVHGPDGKRVASAANKSPDVKIWDAQTGEELLVLKGHTKSPGAMAFSPDGKQLASASYDAKDKRGELKIWDAATGRELRSLTGSFWEVAYSPDGKRLAYSTDGLEGQPAGLAVNVLDVETGRQLLHLPGLGMNVSFSADGKRIAANHYNWKDRKQVDGEVKVWDADSGQEIAALHEKSDAGILFLFSPDGKRIAISGQRAGIPRIKVSDTETGRELFTFQAHTDRVDSLAFSPDSQWLASGSFDRTLRVWDLQTGQEIRTIKNSHHAHFYNGHGIAFSPDGKQLASIFDDKIKIWDLDMGSNPKTFNIAGNRGAISSDFKQLASASPNWRGRADDLTLRIWDAETGRQTKTLKGHKNMIFGVAFSPDGKRLASCDGTAPGTGNRFPGMVKIWDLLTGQELSTIEGHAGNPRSLSLAFSPDGKRLAGCGPRLQMWDTQTGRELLAIDLQRPQEGPGGGWTDVVFSPDGKRVATGRGGTVKIFSTQDGTELQSFNDGGRPVSTRALAFSPDGKRLASGCSGFKIWDAESGRELLSSRMDSRIKALTFSPDGNRLASASDDGTATLWDAQSGHQTLTFDYTADRGYAGGSLGQDSHNVAFSADGHRLASILWDGTVRIWDATPLAEKP